jgi:hypothetical protein
MYACFFSSVPLAMMVIVLVIISVKRGYAPSPLEPIVDALEIDLTSGVVV